MSTPAAAQALVDRIEQVVQTEVGRNIDALCAAARGGLWRAASALAATHSCHVGLITGFFVPQGSPPAAETDGPVGAALLVRGLAEIAVPCRLATDEPCRNACAVALRVAGVPEAPIDVVAVDAPLEPLIETWRAAGITYALSIERCGRSRDGSPRNMRGEDISAHTAPLDNLFAAGPWDTIAIGDGGNEIGMGALPRDLIARHVAHGDRIGCVTPARQLIVAGVSHWGAYALLGALAVVREDWRDRLLRCLDEKLDRQILETMLHDGPAVDGVSRRQAPTIDNFDLAFHHDKLRLVRRLAEGEHVV
ncbi:MAG: glutamate cyclase domain-containing protein [Stellaceae bacterium]